MSLNTTVPNTKNIILTNTFNKDKQYKANFKISYRQFKTQNVRYIYRYNFKTKNQYVLRNI